MAKKGCCIKKNHWNVGSNKRMLQSTTLQYTSGPLKSLSYASFILLHQLFPKNRAKMLQ